MQLKMVLTIAYDLIFKIYFKVRVIRFLMLGYLEFKINLKFEKVVKNA